MSGKSKSLEKQDNEMYIVMVLLIVFAIIVIASVFYMLYKFGNYTQSTYDAIANMQAGTLAITSTSITLASIIISILILFRDKRIEINNRQIGKSIKTIKSQENMINILTNINAVQLLDARDSECYYDAIQQYIREIRRDEKDEDDLSINLRICLINISASIAAKSVENGEHLLKCYSDIISEADKIIKSDDATSLDRHFAYMESLNALYKRVRHTIQTKPLEAEHDLKLARIYLDRVSLINDSDTFGHIHNLKGLIYLWSAIATDRAAIRNNPQNLNKSIEYFTEAVHMNPRKIEFINHLGVAYLKRYEVFGNKNDYNETKKIYESILLIRDDYFKSHLNIADLTTKRLQKEFGTEAHPSLFSPVLKRNDLKERTLKGLNKEIEEAINHFTKAQHLAPNFPNNHYKMAELLTYKLLIYMLLSRDIGEIDEIKTRIERNFTNSRGINSALLGSLFCERNYFELIGETQKAYEINEQIRNGNPDNAEKWENLIRALD